MNLVLVEAKRNLKSVTVNNMKVINGKKYGLWQQFFDQRKEWIGGKLVDTEIDAMETKITDVIFEENGDDSAKFGFKGEDFECWFDVQHGGVGGGPVEEGGISFGSRFGGSFYAVKANHG